MMVTRWGFSPELGTVAYGENQDEVFLGMSVARQQNVSEATAQKIDSEVRRLVEEGLNEARRILTEKQADLETLAQGLLEYETLSGDEIHGSARRPARRSATPASPRLRRGPRRCRPRAAAARARRTAAWSRSRRHESSQAQSLLRPSE